MTQRLKHGGFRPGAGRKPSEAKRVQMTVTVAEGTRDTLKTEAQHRSTKPGRLIDKLVEQEYGKEENL